MSQFMVTNTLDDGAGSLRSQTSQPDVDAAGGQYGRTITWTYQVTNTGSADAPAPKPTGADTTDQDFALIISNANVYDVDLDGKDDLVARSLDEHDSFNFDDTSSSGPLITRIELVTSNEPVNGTDDGLGGSGGTTGWFRYDTTNPSAASEGGMPSSAMESSSTTTIPGAFRAAYTCSALRMRSCRRISSWFSAYHNETDPLRHGRASNRHSDCEGCPGHPRLAFRTAKRSRALLPLQATGYFFERPTLNASRQVAMSTIPAPLVFEVVTQSAQDPFAALDTVLREYNIERSARQINTLWLSRRSRRQGARWPPGRTYWSWCTIDVMAVAKPYRRQGVGSRLLTKAEEIARARGCVGIRLDTTSFQAPDFYHRHGYTEFGRIEDYPPGHARLWFMKKL